MAATIAHEINNPLEAVMNLMYLLRPMIADPAGISYFESVETELGRVSHIARQTLGYYREYAGASSTSIAEIVLHAITIYEPRCTAAGIEIKKAIHSSKTLMLRRGEIMQVISNLMMQALRGEPLTIYGDGSQTRSFCYVSDLIDGIVRLSKSNEHTPVNIGNPSEWTILECAKEVQALLGIDGEIVFKPLPQDDPTRRCPDIARAKELLGWSPRISLREGLAMSLDYFKGCLEKETVSL